jgi:hypothetical protein
VTAVPALGRAIHEILAKYADKADFVTVYIKEAHPLDEWQMDFERGAGASATRSRTTQAERVAIAQDFVERQDWKLPLLVDPLDNRADALYAGWPERLYVVDEQGRIAYKGRDRPRRVPPRGSRGLAREALRSVKRSGLAARDGRRARLVGRPEHDLADVDVRRARHGPGDRVGDVLGAQRMHVGVGLAARSVSPRNAGSRTRSRPARDRRSSRAGSCPERSRRSAS